MYRSSGMRCGLARGSTSVTAFEVAPRSTIAAALDCRATVFSPVSSASRFAGGLIQATGGSGLGDGRPFGNRSGCRANAFARTHAPWSGFASENGLSFETYGREWLLVTPRSASRSATDFEVSYPRTGVGYAPAKGTEAIGRGSKSRSRARTSNAAPTSASTRWSASSFPSCRPAVCRTSRRCGDRRP